MRALSSTVAVMVAIVATVAALGAVAAALYTPAAHMSYRVLDFRVVSLYRSQDGYWLTLVVDNHASQPATITQVSVTDGRSRVVFGDAGAVDGIPASYADTLAGHPVTLPPGGAVTLRLFHAVPRGLVLGSHVTVTVTYRVGGETYRATSSATASFQPQYVESLSSGSTVCGIRVSFTSRDGETHVVHALVFNITRDVLPCLFKYSSPAGHLVIRDQFGVKLPYTVLYSDGNVVWISVRSTVALGTTPYVLTVIATDSGEAAESPTWGWVPANYSLMDTFERTRTTTVFYERLFTSDPEYITVFTHPWYQRSVYTLTGYRLWLPAVRGIDFFIREFGTSTVYQLNFTTADGTEYVAYVKSADWYHPEIVVYKVVDGSLVQVYSRDFGTGAWPGPRFEVVADDSVPVYSTYGRYARFVAGAPIVYVSLLPVSGDSGNSRAYLTVYAGGDTGGAPVPWYLAMWYAIAKVTYLPLS